MKKVSVILLSILLIYHTDLFSQSSYVQSAANILKQAEKLPKSKKEEIKKLLTEAKGYIDKAAANAKTANDEKMWYYKGVTYSMIDRNVLTELEKNAIEIATDALINYINGNKKGFYSDEANVSLIDCGEGLVNKGVTLFNNKEYIASINAYKKIFEVLPFDKSDNLKRNKITKDGIDYNLYLDYNALEDYPNAKKQLQILMDNNYNNPKIYLFMYDILLNKENNPDEAIKALQKGRTLFSEDKLLLDYEIDYYVKQNKMDVLLNKFTEAITNDPEYIAMYVNRGKVYQNEKINKPELALADYKKALELDPDNLDANYGLASVYYNRAKNYNDLMNKLSFNEQKKYDSYKAKRDSDFKESIPYFEKTLELDSEDQVSMKALNQLYISIGDYEKAKAIKEKLDSK